jgi:fructose-specific PTS system IIC-like component
MNDLKKILKNMRTHLMTGVSYMIPFVVAGGIIMAFSVMFSGKAGVPESNLLSGLWTIGVGGFRLMIPILAGYIAYSISGRPGIAPAAIAALIGNDLKAGFFGAIIAGILAGIIVYYIKKIKVPKVVKSIMPIIIIPVITTLIVGGLMYFVIGAPLGSFSENLTGFLSNLQGSNIIVLGIIFGAMIAFDMGGPINKAAYAFTIMTIGSGIYTVAGPSSVAVCTPPIAMGVASMIAPNKYTEGEKEAGKAALLMGAMGLTEGAIPFAAADPLKVIPSIMIGTAASATTAFLLGVETMVAWGGLIVLPVVQGVISWLISLLVGIVVTTLIVNTIKKPICDTDSEDIEEGEVCEELEISFE